MLGNILRRSRFIINNIQMSVMSSQQIQYKFTRNYTPEKIILRNEKTGYFLDPNDVARRLVKTVALHDCIKDPSQITLNKTFFELGIDELSFSEIILEVENEFGLEFPEDDIERMANLEDVVEYVARSFYAH